MGKIRGTPCMRSHMAAHRATTKYFSNSFVFKTTIEKEGLSRDSTPALGAGGLRFKSGRPDQIPKQNLQIHVNTPVGCLLRLTLSPKRTRISLEPIFHVCSNRF